MRPLARSAARLKISALIRRSSAPTLWRNFMIVVTSTTSVTMTVAGSAGSMGLSIGPVARPVNKEPNLIMSHLMRLGPDPRPLLALGAASFALTFHIGCDWQRRLVVGTLGRDVIYTQDSEEGEGGEAGVQSDAQ